MRYILAVVCPPWAMSRAHKPFQATVAAMALVLAAITWSTGVGVLLAALVILWSSRVAGNSYAAEEVDTFLKLFHAEKAR